MNDEARRRNDWDTNCLAEVEGALADKAKLYEMFRVGMAWGGSTFRIAREDFQPENPQFWPISETYQRFFTEYPKKLNDTVASLKTLADDANLSAVSRDHIEFDLALQEQTLSRLKKAQDQIGVEARAWLADPNRSVAYGVSLVRTDNWTPQEKAKLEQIDPTGKDVASIGIVAETMVKPRLEGAISQLPVEEHAVVDRHVRNRLLGSMEDLMALPKAEALGAVVSRIREFENTLADAHGADLTTFHPMRNGDYHVSYDAGESAPMEEADHLALKALYAEEAAAKAERDIERRGALQKFNQEIDAGKYNQFLPFKVAAPDAALSLEDKARLQGLPALQSSVEKPGVGPIITDYQAAGRLHRSVEQAVPVVIHKSGDLFDMDALVQKKRDATGGH